MGLRMTPVDHVLGLNLKIFKKMKTILFDKVLLKTAFCCMASDGHIDSREIEIIKELCNKSIYFNDFDFIKEIQELVEEINQDTNKFIANFLKLLGEQVFTLDEELTLIKFSIETIKADDEIEYAEIKFFKIIRHHLKVENEIILEHFPDIENLLQADIEQPETPELVSDYLQTHKMPDFLQIDFSILDNKE